MGIPPENITRIFDPFFTTKGETGTGLGLSISHGAIRSLGGDIRVMSSPGQGTTFQVIASARQGVARRRPRQLPRGPRADAAARAGRRRRDASSARPSRGRSRRRTTSRSSPRRGRRSRAIAKGDRYDVILCDLMMPVMTGMDLYAEVVRVAPKLVGRLVFMTGGAFTPRARAFLESVSNPCLEKPLDTSQAAQHHRARRQGLSARARRA